MVGHFTKTLFYISSKLFFLFVRYIARSEFTRTTAVISIVGYILGLGDRHGENILLDSTNGGVIHVDFNCLFNRVLNNIL